MGRLGALLDLSDAVLEVSWAILGLSWTVLGASAMGTRALGEWAGAGDRGGATDRSFPRPRLWALFRSGTRQTQGLGHKNECILASMRGGALIIASQEAKGPDTHLPLQARWRIMAFAFEFVEPFMWIRYGRHTTHSRVENHPEDRSAEAFRQPASSIETSWLKSF